MTGKSAELRVLRTSASTSSPLTPGIITSSTTKSTAVLARIDSACSPDVARTTE
jgi:hypothetical protein